MRVRDLPDERQRMPLSLSENESLPSFLLETFSIDEWRSENEAGKREVGGGGREKKKGEGEREVGERDDERSKGKNDERTRGG